MSPIGILRRLDNLSKFLRGSKVLFRESLLLGGVAFIVNQLENKV
jgi:hypothetical protein